MRGGHDPACYCELPTGLSGISIVSVSRPRRTALCPFPTKAVPLQPVILIWASGSIPEHFRAMRSSELHETLRHFMTQESADPRCYIETARSGRTTLREATLLRAILDSREPSEDRGRTTVVVLR